jgi:putative ATPase
MSEDLFGDVAGQTGPAGGGPYGGSAARGSLAGSDRHGLPPAVRMRPRTLEEFIGQQHLLAPGVSLMSAGGR